MAGETQGATKRPVLHHVTLKTARLQEMVDWYRLVAGVEVNFQDAVAAWTTNDRANHRVAFLALPGLIDDPEKRRRTGMHHMAFEHASHDELFADYERLKAAGVTPAFCLDHGLTTSLYYNDPDGNVVEMQADNFGDWEGSTNFMRTSEAFKANPIGVFFDPDKVMAARRDGQPAAEVQRGTYSGKYQPEPIPDLGIG